MPHLWPLGRRWEAAPGTPSFPSLCPLDGGRRSETLQSTRPEVRSAHAQLVGVAVGTRADRPWARSSHAQVANSSYLPATGDGHAEIHRARGNLRRASTYARVCLYSVLVRARAHAHRAHSW